MMRKVLLRDVDHRVAARAGDEAGVRAASRCRAFMPGEKLEDALGAAATLKPQRITTILTRLGENLTRLDEAEAVTAALPRRARQGARRPGSTRRSR